MPPDLRILVGAGHVDRSWLIPTLKGSYWGGHYTEDGIVTAIYRSLCFNAWIGEQQVGFARVLTDAAVVSMLTDVIVDEAWRGKGIFRGMMEAVFTHYQIAHTICVIQAREENIERYAKFGFVSVDSMFKRDPQ